MATSPEAQKMTMDGVHRRPASSPTATTEPSTETEPTQKTITELENEQIDQKVQQPKPKKTPRDNSVVTVISIAVVVVLALAALTVLAYLSGQK